MQVIKNNALFTQVAVEDSSFVSGGLTSKVHNETCTDPCHHGTGGLVRTASAFTVIDTLLGSDKPGNSEKNNSNGSGSGIRDAAIGSVFAAFLLC